MSSAMVWWSDPQFDTKGCDSVAGRGAGPKKSPALFFLAVILKVEQNQFGQTMSNSLSRKSTLSSPPRSKISSSFSIRRSRFSLVEILFSPFLYSKK